MTAASHARFGHPLVLGLLVALLSAPPADGARLQAASLGTPAPADLTPCVGLHEAAKSGDAAAVRRLLACGADVNAVDRVGSSPLHVAAYWNRREIVELLVANGADVNAKNHYGWTPVHTSLERLLTCAACSTAPDAQLAAENAAAIATFLVNSGASATAASENGDTPLHLAAASGYVGLVEFLLGKGAGIDVPGSNGVTALYAATKYDRPDVARLLVSRGADVDRATKGGLTPLIWTAYSGNFVIAELLVAHGARADARDRSGMSALYWALLMRFQFESGGGRIAFAEHLLRLSQDQQAAAWAEAKNMRKQWREVALLLIEHGADVNASPSGGPATPLYFAANVDDLLLTEALVDKGADVNPARNCGCESPLHAALAERRRDVAELLIRRGADVNDRNQSKRTPLHFLARDIDDPALAELMIARGAWVNATDKDGNTPLDFALGLGNLKVARVLQMRGGVRSDQIPNRRGLGGQHST